MLPQTENTLVIRTDFSSDPGWERLCTAIGTPSGDFGFLPNIELVNDRAYDGATPQAIVAEASGSLTLFFVVDRMTLYHPEQPILAVYCFDGPIQTLRVIPSELWNIENNVSLGNMDFEEFAENAEPDGVFRGRV